MKGKLWHVCVQGNGGQSMFLDKSDVLHFIDLLGVYSFYYGVKIWAYDILSNHFHLILECENPQRFIHALRISYSRYYLTVHNTIGSVGRNGYSAGLLNSKEKTIEKIIYVLRNSVKHQVYPHSFVDPYNSAKYYFLTNHEDSMMTLKPVGPKCKLSHSEKIIPEHYLLDAHGNIYPRSFLKISSIENVFGTYDNFMRLITYPLQKESDKQQKNKDILNNGDEPNFAKVTDLQLSELILKQIRPKQFSSLSDIEIVSIAILCKKKYPVSVRQLSRVFGIPESTLRLRMQQGWQTMSATQRGGKPGVPRKGGKGRANPVYRARRKVEFLST